MGKPKPSGGKAASSELKDAEVKEQLKAGKGTVAKKAAAAAAKKKRPLWKEPYAIAALAVAVAVPVFLSLSAMPSVSHPPSLERPPIVKPPTVDDGARDNHTECVQWAAAGECKNNPDFMLSSCKVACRNAGKPNAAPGGPPQDLWANPSECANWAGSGECEKNKQFMESNCALSCQRIIDNRAEYARRCPRPPGAKPALAPGGMNATFERIMGGEFSHLEPEMIWSDPPVVLFHKFLSDAEAAAYVGHGKGKYAESKGVGVDEKTGKMAELKTEILSLIHI